ncbi:hypothetical protein CLV63_1269 [Murinocardiopsis flavida]|uniref:Uncharacterized protein n=1 Tax=Murinocardiopsis flavida TaxID=645275 RepID=A0A2P8CWL3_9ACTN|nr:hypothetical protein [Murinocardiopsis flavida]PSK89373.1 hypothetical protein CLV63_1269 [Murinocardiopsis flavida]
MIASTPRGDEIRATVEARLREARRGGATPETVRVVLRGQPANLEVITMPVSDLYYNPRTRRIRAQRAHDPVRDAELDEYPWSGSSQDYLHDLLTKKPDNPDAPDPSFDALKKDLAEFGQNDAGIITHSGILVNGNTRKAALEELTRPNMRVAVLPADASWLDVDEIELQLQLQTDHRRDYSYINRILAIHEQIAAGRAVPEIVKDFRTTRASVDADMWIYSFITDAIERSRTELASGHEAALRLMDFEGHQESLKELHRHQKAAGRREADTLKESRLLAILMDTAKTKLRYIDDGFHKDYLAPKLDARFAPVAEPDRGGGGGVPGFDPGAGLELEGDDATVKSARAATDAVLKAKVKQAFAGSITPKEAGDAQEILSTVSEVLERGVERAEATARRNQRRNAAAERLAEVTGLVREATQQAAQARSQDLMHHEALDAALVELSTALKQLSRVASRGVEHPGRGLVWLQESVADL